MIFYMPAPLELLDRADDQKIVNIPLPSGGSLRAEAVEYDKIRVLDLLSTDPNDYMDERLRPGMVITLKPSI